MEPLRIALMIEGQEGVSWSDWVSIARACEESGIEALFRSDHYASGLDYDARGSLDAWATLAGLAAETEHLRLGTLVSPVTFRHPSVLARMATTVDHISGGRLEVGLGAGWQELEHAAFGLDLPPDGERLDMLDEYAEVVHQLWTEESVDFHGRHYRLENARALPKPVQAPHPPIVVGGHGGPRSAAIAARWADEYNTLVAGLEEFRERAERVRQACDEVGRDPDTMRLSLMVGCILGTDEGEVRERTAALLRHVGFDLEVDAFIAERRERWIIGTPDEAMARLRDLAAAGADGVMLQHLVHDDLETIRLIGHELVGR